MRATGPGGRPVRGCLPNESGQPPAGRGGLGTDGTDGTEGPVEPYLDGVDAQRPRDWAGSGVGAGDGDDAVADPDFGGEGGRGRQPTEGGFGAVWLAAQRPERIGQGAKPDQQSPTGRFDLGLDAVDGDREVGLDGEWRDGVRITHARGW